MLVQKYTLFQGVLDRFSQIKPKLIFSVNAVWYNGRVHNHLEKLQQVVKGWYLIKVYTLLLSFRIGDSHIC